MRPPIAKRNLDPTTRLLVACGIVAPVVALSVFAAAALLRPGYDHVADTVSKLSAQGVADRWLWTAGLVAYAFLMLLHAGGLRRRFGFTGPARMLWGGVATHAVLMIGVALFRDDLRPGGFFTVQGAVHDVLSGMAFSALVVAMVGAVAVANVDRALRSFRSVTLIMGTAVTAIGIAFLFIAPGVQGVPQRAFVALAAIWIVMLAIWSMAPPAPE